MRELLSPGFGLLAKLCVCVWLPLLGETLTPTSPPWRTERTAGPPWCWRSAMSFNRLLTGCHGDG